MFSQYNIIDGCRDWNIQFKRAIDLSLISSIVDLICFLNSYQWSDTDAITWRRRSNGKFSVSSFYKLINNGVLLFLGVK